MLIDYKVNDSLHQQEIKNLHRDKNYIVFKTRFLLGWVEIKLHITEINKMFKLIKELGE